MSDYDPFERIRTGQHRAASGERPLADAISMLFRSRDKREVLPLLQSPDPPVVTDALYLLSEAGPLPAPIIDLALSHVGHAAWDARFYLANALLVSHHGLTPEQIAKALTLADDAKLEVRCKVMELLSHLRMEALEEAINRVGVAPRGDHEAGLAILRGAETTASDMISTIGKRSRIEACYAGALVLKKAMQGALIPEFDAVADEAPYLARRVEQLQRRKNV